MRGGGGAWAGRAVDARTPAGGPCVAGRTGIASARARPDQRDDKVVRVLAEPTAALPSRDVERLFATIRSLQSEGNSIVIVSHHLDEILGGSLQHHDTLFLVSTDDDTDEFSTGVGVAPDEVIMQRQSDALLGIDTVVEAARAWLLEGGA